MIDSQGRGSYFDEGRIERIAKRAKENGGDDSAIKKAIEQEVGRQTKEVVDQIKAKVMRLL